MTSRRIGSLLLSLAVASGAVRAADPSPTPTTPAVQMMVSADLLARAFAGPLNMSSPVQSVSGSQSATGTAQLVGSRRLELVPCDSMAVVRLSVDAASAADLVVQRPRARVYANTTGTVAVAQDLFLSRDGLSAGVPAVSTPTSVFVGRVETDLPPVRDVLVRGVVRFAATVTAGELSTQATTQVQKGVRSALGDETTRQLSAANAQFATALAEAGIAKNRLRFATTSSALCAVIDQPAPFPASLPAFDPTAAVRIAVHTSFVNSLLESLLAGKTFTRADLTTSPKDGKGLSGLFPAPAEGAKETPKGDEPDWSLTFTKKEPVSFTADRGEIRMVVRLAEIVADGNDVPAMNVTIRWGVEVRNGRAVLVRTKPPEVYPPGFVPGGGQRMTAREVSYRTVLNRRFDKLLPAELELDKAMRGVLPHVAGSPLAPTKVMAAGDWVWVELR